MAFQTKCLGKMSDVSATLGRTILYVSHNMNTIRRLCTRCIVLDEGRIIFDGDVDQAIGIYMGIEDRLKTSFRYGEEFRPYGRFSRRFSLEELEALGVEEPLYPENGHAAFRIHCRAAEELRNVRFRMELWYQDGSKLGSMLSNPIPILHAGDHTVSLEMDLTGLTNGQYSADLVAYTADARAVEEILDGVYPGFVFNVIETPEVDHHVEWSHQYWGHIRLRDMRLECGENSTARQKGSDEAFHGN
jgi:lipopolysaccharide transport system ATP-binding protein